MRPRADSSGVLEGEWASCAAIHTGVYHDTEAFHAAAEEPREVELSLDDNYYEDPDTGHNTFSLWCYPPAA